MIHTTIKKTAIATWSPDFDRDSIIACGSVSGALDDSFSTESLLELYSTSNNPEAKLVASISSEARFCNLSWTQCSSSEKKLIVGALENGSVSVWDSSLTVESSGSQGLLESFSSHSGPVKGLGNSRFQGNLMVTGAGNGELYLWDLNNFEKTSRLQIQKSSKFTDVTGVSWNRKVPHIVAVSSASGVVSILDLRNKKEVVALMGPGASSIDWNPENPTNLMVASEDDNNPHLYSWDLRNSSAAEKVLQSHTKGILSVAWCPRDPELLLSAGKDSRVLCWNPRSGEVVNEVQSHSNWVYNVSWCPKNPDLLACCSYDGSVHVSSYQNLSLQSNSHQDPVQHSNQEAVQSSPRTSIVSGKPPKWLERPIGASFGPGTKCAIFRSDQRSVSLVEPVLKEGSQIQAELDAFLQKLQTEGPVSVCEHLAESSSEASLWRLTATLFSQNFNSDILAFIGFEAIERQSSEASDLIHSGSAATLGRVDSHASSDELKDGKGFEIFSDDMNEIDRVITEKLITFDVHGAVSACIQAKRFADAMIIASCAGKDLREEVGRLYLESQGTPLYLRLAQAIKHKDMSDLVQSGSLNDWKEILSLIMNHSDADKFITLSSQLACRLEGKGFFIGAAAAHLVANNVEAFIRVSLNLLVKESSGESFLESFNSLFDAYKFINIVKCYSPNILSSFEDAQQKIKLQEILVKIAYILRACGLADSNAEQYPELAGINTDLDVFLESLRPLPEVTQQPCDQPPIQSYNQPLIQSYNQPFVQNYQTLQPQYPVTSQLPSVMPQVAQVPSHPAVPQMSVLAQAQLPTKPIKAIPPISPTWSPEGSPKTYNDAPIIKPRGSLLVPDITNQVSAMGIKELDAEMVSKAINVLVSLADQKSQGIQKRLVSECASKLSTQVICRDNYSSSAQTSVIALFNAINQSNMELSGKITSTLLTVYFSETKNWILNLKRLLDIAKN